jgi:hypothetical protein
MPVGLHPGDRVALLAAYSGGLHTAAAQVLVSSAEVVRVLEDSGGLGGGYRQTGVQVRVPADRASSLATAIAGGRVFVAKALSPLGRSALGGAAPTSAAPGGASFDAGSDESSRQRSDAPGGSP